MADRGILEGLSDEQISAIRVLCEQSQHAFTALMFRAMEGKRFRLGRHHKLIDETLDKVVTGEIPRLIVNEPPGYSKTLQCVIMFVARGFAINARCRFLHASYSRELVNLNSAQIIDVMSLPEYRFLWGRTLRQDSSAKGLWRTPEGGMFKASSAGGAVTGFRAGTLDEVELTEEEQLALAEQEFDQLGVEVDELTAYLAEQTSFSGALIIDDPLKPDDASSDIKRNFVNARYMNTFRSRLAHERVPIIVSMQRIHPKDFSNFLLTGGGGEKFHHLMLPIEIDNSLGYPTAFTYGIHIAHGLADGPLWPTKHTQPQIDVLKRDSKVFSAQYAQNPLLNLNAMFKATYFRAYEVRPRTLSVGIIVDPSGGKSRKSDRTAMAVVGIDSNANKYLLDGYCHRMKLSERWIHLRRLYDRWATAPGIMTVQVGYEQYGMQADLEHIKERQQIEGKLFDIVPVAWVREGSQSKEDRIQRLEPDFKGSRFWMPATVWRAEEGGDCFWEGKDHGVEFRKAWGKTTAQKTVAQAGEAFRVQGSLSRRDQDGNIYDLTMMLMQELIDFPNAAFDDLGDAVSRIYDLDMIPAPRGEVNMVSGLNEQLEA